MHRVLIGRRVAATSPRRIVGSVPARPAHELAGPFGGSAPVFLIVLAALAAVLALDVVAPDYFTRRGFPLDDAWIHLVYGRELARTGTWAYNPGIAATGSTSPLWSAVLALVHLAVDSPQPAVLVIKWVGFVLHVLTALLLYAAFGRKRQHASMPLFGALLVAAHPDLVSASVSGMEVPLATLTAAALVWAMARRGFALYAVLAAAAFLARPELALISMTLPLVAATADRRVARRMIAGALGTTIAAVGWAGHNLAVSGWPLPATFYAKVGQGAEALTALQMGFGLLVPELAIASLTVCLGLLALAALRSRPGDDPALPTVVAAFVVALVYCAASFVLIPPHDRGAFYHQRYVLPALPLLVAAATRLASAAFGTWLPDAGRVPSIIVGTLLALTLLLDMPERYQHLENDARNIDDVQVAIGRSLAGAAPGDVAWAVDAGAIRYFGKAFVVDLMGLNTPEILDRTAAQTFLDAHPPRYLEVVPLWSTLASRAQNALTAARFQPSTPYTVTRYPAMQVHELFRCEPGVSGEISVRGRSLPFTCAR